MGGTTNNPDSNTSKLNLLTPHLDQLIAQGVRFTRAFVPSPVCAPSRACLASGREYDYAGQGANAASRAGGSDFDLRQGTFMRVLQQQGYYNMIAGRDDLTKRTGPGIDGGYPSFELGFNASGRCAGSVDVSQAVSVEALTEGLRPVQGYGRAVWGLPCSAACAERERACSV